MAIKNFFKMKPNKLDNNVGTVSIQCPNCKSNLHIDNCVDLCYCQYCGSQVAVTGQNSKIVGARIFSKAVDKHYEAKQQKLEVKRQAEINKQQEAAKTKKRLLIAMPIIIVIYVAVFLGMKISSNKEEEKLEALSIQIQEDISAGNYDKALAEANQLQYTGNWSDDIEKKWNNTKDAYITIISEKTGKTNKNSDEAPEVDNEIEDTASEEEKSLIKHEKIQNNQTNKKITETPSVNKVKMPHESSYYLEQGWDKDTLIEHLQGLGFTNIESFPYEPDNDTYNVLISELHIYTSKHDYKDEWSKGEVFPADTEINFSYNNAPMITTDNTGLNEYLTGDGSNYLDFSKEYDGIYVSFDAVVFRHLTYMGDTGHVIDLKAYPEGCEVRVDETYFGEIDKSIEEGDSVHIEGKIDFSQSEYFKELTIKTTRLKKL